jgi:type IV secretory pathway protease TraF
MTASAGGYDGVHAWVTALVLIAPIQEVCHDDLCSEPAQQPGGLRSGHDCRAEHPVGPPAWQSQCAPGVYRLAVVAPPLARGTAVVLPVPTAVRPWHRRWAPLRTPVAAVGGDGVCLGDEGLWVAGQWYGPVSQAAGDALLPRLRGCLRLPPGDVLLGRQAPRRVDGPYVGPTPVAALMARAIPLMTWR